MKGKEYDRIKEIIPPKLELNIKEEKIPTKTRQSRTKEEQTPTKTTQSIQRRRSQNHQDLS